MIDFEVLIAVSSDLVLIISEYLTKHAACPVLVGSKWVSNKWLHEYGQEWTRPCELHETPTGEAFHQKAILK